MVLAYGYQQKRKELSLSNELCYYFLPDSHLLNNWQKQGVFLMEIALTNIYPPPVDQLLTCGETGTLSPEEWPNYFELGISSEHIPELIRLATDEQLNTIDVDSS